MNLMKAAIRHSTLLSTVSPTYAREIQTSEYGFGLDGELAARGRDLRGVLNGIDRRVEPSHGSLPARALRQGRSGWQSSVQGGPAKRNGSARAP
jgi:glycogen synthase